VIFEVMDDLVEGWESRLRELTGRMGHLFARPEPREVFADLVDGLLSDLEKKNCCCDTRSHVLSELVEENRRMSKT
jgi:hypothetical protein